MSGSATLLRSPACTHGPDFILRSPPQRACPTTHRPTDTPSASTSTRPKHTTANATPVYVSAVLMEEHYQDLAKLLEEYCTTRVRSPPTPCAAACRTRPRACRQMTSGSALAPFRPPSARRMRPTRRLRPESGESVCLGATRAPWRGRVEDCAARRGVHGGTVNQW